MSFGIPMACRAVGQVSHMLIKIAIWQTTSGALQSYALTVLGQMHCWNPGSFPHCHASHRSMRSDHTCLASDATKRSLLESATLYSRDILLLMLLVGRLQGLFVAFLVGGGAIATVRDGKNLQNFLICVEMLPAALGMLFAFPYTEYKGGPGESSAQSCE